MDLLQVAAPSGGIANKSPRSDNSEVTEKKVSSFENFVRRNDASRSKDAPDETGMADGEDADRLVAALPDDLESVTSDEDTPASEETPKEPSLEGEAIGEAGGVAFLAENQKATAASRGHAQVASGEGGLERGDLSKTSRDQSLVVPASARNVPQDVAGQTLLKAGELAQRNPKDHTTKSSRQASEVASKTAGIAKNSVLTPENAAKLMIAQSADTQKSKTNSVETKSSMTLSEAVLKEAQVTQATPKNPQAKTAYLPFVAESTKLALTSIDGGNSVQSTVIGETVDIGLRSVEPGKGAAPALQLTSAPIAMATGTEPRSSHVVYQVAQAMGAADGQDFELRLDPAELGKVRITMSARDGQMVAVITAERPETLDLLRKNADQLETGFAEKGFSDASLSFEGQNDDQAEEASVRGNISLAEMEIEGEERLLATTALVGVNDSLDIRL